jgi:hypothetical protein
VLLTLIITLCADLVLLATMLITIKAGTTMYFYNHHQDQGYHHTYVYHKRRTSSTITKFLFKTTDIFSYLQKHIGSRMPYIEKLLGQSGRKSRTNTTLCVKHYGKRPWRLRNITQHTRRMVATSHQSSTILSRYRRSAICGK